MVFSKQPSVNETSRSAGAVNIQAHVPDPTWAQIASVQKRGVTTALSINVGIKGIRSEVKV